MGWPQVMEVRNLACGRVCRVCNRRWCVEGELKQTPSGSRPATSCSHECPQPTHPGHTSPTLSAQVWVMVRHVWWGGEGRWQQAVLVACGVARWEGGGVGGRHGGCRPRVAARRGHGNVAAMGSTAGRQWRRVGKGRSQGAAEETVNAHKEWKVGRHGEWAGE